MTEKTLIKGLTYTIAKKLLESIKCLTCQGSGEIDDAAPGDISFNTYICNKCKGTGLKE